MFDINGGEFVIIALIAVVLLGPDRLPEYVRGLGNLVRRARVLMREGQQAIRDELGEEVDWRQYDPRQYDPRRIVKDALLGDDGAEPFTSTIDAVTGRDTAGTQTAARGSGRVGEDAPSADDGPREPSARSRAAAQRRKAAAEALRASGVQDGGSAPFDTDAT